MCWTRAGCPSIINLVFLPTTRFGHVFKGLEPCLRLYVGWWRHRLRSAHTVVSSLCTWWGKSNNIQTIAPRTSESVYATIFTTKLCPAHHSNVHNSRIYISGGMLDVRWWNWVWQMYFPVFLNFFKCLILIKFVHNSYQF